MPGFTTEDGVLVRERGWLGNVEVRWFAWMPTMYARTASIGWAMYRAGDVAQGPLNGGSRDVADPDDPAAVLGVLATLAAEAAAARRAHLDRQLLAIADELDPLR